MATSLHFYQIIQDFTDIPVNAQTSQYNRIGAKIHIYFFYYNIRGSVNVTLPLVFLLYLTFFDVHDA